MKRRALLTITGATLCGFAGCTSFNDESEESILDSISVRNRSGETREVDVVVIEDEEIVFEETYTIDSGTEPVDENPVDGSGHYLVRVSTTDNNQEVETQEHINEDERCVNIRFEINSFGGFNPPSIISYQEC